MCVCEHNGISTIVSVLDAPPPTVPDKAKIKRKILFFLERRTLSINQVSERVGCDRKVAYEMVRALKLARQITVAYRTVVRYDIQGPGRKTHVVAFYRAR